MEVCDMMATLSKARAEQKTMKYEYEKVALTLGCSADAVKKKFQRWLVKQHKGLAHGASSSLRCKRPSL